MVEEVGSETTAAPEGAAAGTIGDGQTAGEYHPNNAAADWGAVRVDYEGSGLTLRQVAIKHQVTKAGIEYHAKKEGWVARRPSALSARHKVIDRLFRVLEGQIEMLEGRMKNSGEKEVALLGSTIRNFEKLVAIQKAERPKRGTKTQHKNMGELRDNLAKRIDQLVAQ